MRNKIKLIAELVLLGTLGYQGIQVGSYAIANYLYSKTAERISELSNQLNPSVSAGSLTQEQRDTNLRVMGEMNELEETANCLMQKIR